MGWLGDLLIIEPGAQEAGDSSLGVVTIMAARARDRGRSDTGSSSFCLEVTHVNSTHISLATANYRAMPNAKGQRSPLLPRAQENQNLYSQLS